jgi:hypothetical protein
LDIIILLFDLGFTPRRRRASFASPEGRGGPTPLFGLRLYSALRLRATLLQQNC